MSKHLSQEDLQKYQQRLLEEKQKIEKEIEILKREDPFKDIDRLTDNKPEEDAQEEIVHETIEAQINALSETLQEIEKALKRIRKGTYGKCELCDKPIEKERLDLVPYARFCSKCQKKIE